MSQTAAKDTNEIRAGQGIYLTHIGLLNEIYQAAKAVLVQPDKFALGKLARAIHQAEWGVAE